MVKNRPFLSYSIEDGGNAVLRVQIAGVRRVLQFDYSIEDGGNAVLFLEMQCCVSSIIPCKNAVIMKNRRNAVLKAAPGSSIHVCKITVFAQTAMVAEATILDTLSIS